MAVTTPVAAKTVAVDRHDTAKHVPGNVPALDVPTTPCTPSKRQRVDFTDNRHGYSLCQALHRLHNHMLNEFKERPSDRPLLATVSPEHTNVVAMLVQDRDSDLPTLITDVQRAITPALYIDGEEAKPNDWVSRTGLFTLITEIADRVNYGVPKSVLLDEYRDDWPVNVPPPQSVCIWRWELRDLSTLPPDLISVMQKRREQRVKAQEDAKAWFATLQPESKKSILEQALKVASENVMDSGPLNADAIAGDLLKCSDKVQDSGQTRAKTPSKGLLKKKDLGIDKGQRKLMGFFSVKEPSKATELNQGSAPQTYYEQLFHPFRVRANTMISRLVTRTHASGGPSNVPASAAERPEFDRDRLALEFSLWVKRKLQPTPKAQGGDGPIATPPPPPHPINQTPSNNNNDDGDDDYDECDEGEKLLERLRRYPMKLIRFHDNRRPAYWGTWMKQIKYVSGRRPFAKDVSVLDYSIDSDIEWEEEGEGEELASEDDDDDEEDEDVSDGEGGDELDGWLTDDNEPVGKHPGTVNSTGYYHAPSDDDSDDEEDEDFTGDSSNASDEDALDDELDDINASEEVSESHLMKSERETRENAVKNRFRPKARARQLEAAQVDKTPTRRRVVKPLVPVSIGPVWFYNESDVAAEKLEVLRRFMVKSLYGEGFPIRALDLASPKPAQNTDPTPANGPRDGSAGLPGTPSRLSARKKQPISEKDILTIAQTVKVKLPDYSKHQIEMTIRAHFTKKKFEGFNKQLWAVNDDIAEKASQNGIVLSRSLEKHLAMADNGEPSKRPESKHGELEDNGTAQSPLPPPLPPKRTLETMFMSAKKHKS
ncbi:hypothetical protein EV182_002234 [Spiromyces aspiralis]|uniref:Uncharacterized protein n=1 Tax=Spiromyces aspiralis TaxID=68401 RepID=A0ACC1HM07_9FUNG|nr:hypothetical protein EV182_002234 [Spiromyces aspiralis]